RTVAFGHLDRVPVPFAVRSLGHRDVVIGAKGLGDRPRFRREGGNRKQAPVDEDPELGVLIPSRHRMRVERFQRCFVWHHPTLAELRRSQPPKICVSIIADTTPIGRMPKTTSVTASAKSLPASRR